MASLFANFDDNKDVFLDTDEFTSYILTELDNPEFSLHREKLQKELESTRITTLKTQNELIAYNDKKFNLLKDYVASENGDIAKLQNIVNLLNKDISGTPRQLIADIDPTLSRSAHLLNEFNTYQDNTSIGNSVNMSQDE